jgi:hypothetical protein
LFRPRRALDAGEAVIAVELADDFHHAIDRLEIPAAHCAVRNKQRLAEALLGVLLLSAIPGPSPMRPKPRTEKTRASRCLVLP